MFKILAILTITIFGLVLLAPQMGSIPQAFAITQKVTFFDDCAAIGTINPFVGDPKTNDYADLVLTKPLTNRGGNSAPCITFPAVATNLDETNPGGFPPPERTIFLDMANAVGGCNAAASTGDVLEVARGYEEGEFAFTGLNPLEKFAVTVVLSDIDDCGMRWRLNSDVNDPLKPVLETVFVSGNGVELGFVDAAGLGTGDHALLKQFTVLAMPDGSGDLVIGFNTVSEQEVSDGTPPFFSIFTSGFGVEQIIIESASDVPVGGKLIEIDTTSLLVAGTQMTAAWLIPVIVAAIGIGIIIARKF